MSFNDELVSLLLPKYKGRLSITGSDTGKRFELYIEPGDVRSVLKAVYDAGYNYFIGITVIDYPMENVFELVYLLSSIERNGELLVVRTKIKRDEPFIDSVANIYPLAYYQEIEGYEFFGIIFRGHNGLRKWILLDNWEGPPPLRKDIDTRQIVLEIFYGGKRYERPRQWRSLGGYSGLERGGENE